MLLTGVAFLASGWWCPSAPLTRLVINWPWSNMKMKKEIGAAGNRTPAYVRGDLSDSFWFCCLGLALARLLFLLLFKGGQIFHEAKPGPEWETLLFLPAVLWWPWLEGGRCPPRKQQIKAAPDQMTPNPGQASQKRAALFY